MSSATCAFVAGESSGDLLAAGVVGRLRSQEPALRCVGVGGDRMIASGFEAWAHVRELSVRGYVEVLRHLPRLLALRRSLRRRLLAAPPAIFVGVDAPDFNLGLEEPLRASGIRVVHYVSPSIWAWRSERIHQIRRAVDRMLLVFPFEQRIYDAAGIPATYVGHPLANMIPMVPDALAARARLGLDSLRPAGRGAAGVAGGRGSTSRVDVLHGDGALARSRSDDPLRSARRRYNAQGAARAHARRSSGALRSVDDHRRPLA